MKRKCINSDGEPFHQCLLNKQSPLTSSHRAKKKTKTYYTGNLGLGLGQILNKNTHRVPVKRQCDYLAGVKR